MVDDQNHFPFEHAGDVGGEPSESDFGGRGLFNLGIHATSLAAAMTSSRSTRSLFWLAAVNMAVRARLPMARGIPPDWTKICSRASSAKRRVLRPASLRWCST